MNVFYQCFAILAATACYAIVWPLDPREWFNQ